MHDMISVYGGIEVGPILQRVKIVIRLVTSRTEYYIMIRRTVNFDATCMLWEHTMCGRHIMCVQYKYGIVHVVTRAYTIQRHVGRYN